MSLSKIFFQIFDTSRDNNVIQLGNDYVIQLRNDYVIQLCNDYVIQLRNDYVIHLRENNVIQLRNDYVVQLRNNPTSMTSCMKHYSRKYEYSNVGWFISWYKCQWMRIISFC